MLTCQTPFYLTGPLLSSVAQLQSETEYWWEGSTSSAIPSASSSNIKGQYNIIVGTTFGAAFVQYIENHTLGSYMCFFLIIFFFLKNGEMVL